MEDGGDEAAAFRFCNVEIETRKMLNLRTIL